MVKILPFIIVALLLVGGLGYWRFSTARQSLDSVQPSPIEVPKTLPGASLEERVKTLEDTVTALVNKANSTPAPQSSSLDSRVSDLEAAVTELKARVTSLENSSTGTPQTGTSTSSKPTVYIPLGSSGTVNSQSWTSLSTFQVSLNPSQYPGYYGMQLEVNMRLNQPGGTLYARLYNVSTGLATSAEINTTATDSTVVSSANFTIPSATDTYILQAKTSDGTLGFLDYARIKVNF